MKNIIAIFLLSLFLNTWGQEEPRLEVQLTEIRDARTDYWAIDGSTDLPKGAILALQILFEEAELRNSRTRIRTREGKFRYLYPIRAQSILDGNYTVRVVYLKSMQTPSFLEQHSPGEFKKSFSFYLGKRSSERIKRQTYQIFLIKSVQEINALLKHFTEKTNEFLDAPTSQVRQNKEKVINHIQENLKVYREIQKNYQGKIYPQVLAPYSISSINNLKAILELSDTLLRYNTHRLVKYYSLSSRFPGQQVSQSISTSGYRDNITRLGNHILEQESPQNKTHIEDFQADILWFNEIFTSVGKEKREAEKEFSSTEWEKYLVSAKEEVSLFEKRISEYEGSYLAQNYPEISSLFTKMIRQINTLLLVYTKDLYIRNNRQASEKIASIKENPEKVILDLQTSFASLFEIISIEGEKQKEKQSSWEKQIQKTLQEASILQEELEERTSQITIDIRPEKLDLLIKNSTWSEKLAKLERNISRIGKQEKEKNRTKVVRKLRNLFVFLRKIQALLEKLENSENRKNIASIILDIKHYQRRFHYEEKSIRDHL